MAGMNTVASLFGIAIILLNVLWWIIIVQAILSWLIAFNVVNMTSPFVRSLATALDRLTAPLYRPIRRFPILAGSISRRWWCCC